MMLAFNSLDKIKRMTDSDNKLVHFVASNEGYLPINPPKWSAEIECQFCGSREFFLWTNPDRQVVWFCGRICERSKLKKQVGSTFALPTVKRSIEWHLFCELNDIGDEFHDVRFEDVNQSEGKISYMLKFLESPRGIIFMYGNVGTGKTYASMAMCEFYTRKSVSCMFTSHTKMGRDWRKSYSFNAVGDYINEVKVCNLLVIDEFGIGESDPKFMEFFMELINTRNQWKNRGTVITSNLSKNEFSKFCGQALADRIRTGQIFEFEGGSRRKKIIL